MSYNPTQANPQNFEQLRRYTEEQLRYISNAINQLSTSSVQLTEFNAPPRKPTEGVIVYADGTNWNPGSGRGLYQYRSSIWEFIG